MLKTKEEIEKWLNKYEIINYIINTDLTVDIEGSVDLSSQELDMIPINFNKVNKYFDCSYNNLTSLKFAPKEMQGDFNCSYNELISLDFCPKKINGNFNCSGNKLTSLKFLPQEINGILNIERNNIKKDSLYFFNSHISGYIFSDFGNKEEFLLLVQEQKMLHEKEEINNNLHSTQNSQVAKKRL